MRGLRGKVQEGPGKGEKRCMHAKHALLQAGKGTRNRGVPTPTHHSLGPQKADHICHTGRLGDSTAISSCSSNQVKAN